MVLTNVLGVAYTIRATMDALVESKGHLLLTGSLAGPPRAAGVALLGDEVRGHLDGRGRAPGAERHGRPRHADRARAWSTRRSSTSRPVGMLEADDIARAVMYAVSQPPHVDVNEILIRPTAQEAEPS